jgi:hypothetical protein
MGLHWVTVNYTDLGDDVQTDGVVPLENYPFLHVEPTGDAWEIQASTIPVAPTGGNTTTLAGTYATRADALSAMNALLQESGNVLYGTLS